MAMLKTRRRTYARLPAYPRTASASECTPMKVAAVPTTDSATPDTRLIQGRTPPTRVMTLGSGSFGTVSLATMPEEGTRVAVKSFRPCAENHDVTVDAIREVGILAVLRGQHHPNLLGLLQVHCDESLESCVSLSLVLELATCDLHQHLRRVGCMSAPVARAVMVQVASGLAHLHARGIMHRDLKPQNVLIKEDGCVQLADFGLAMPRIAGRLNSYCVGTLNYQAPEMLLGDRCYGFPGDLWAFACVYAELRNGKFAFHGEEPCDLFVPSSEPSSCSYSPDESHIVQLSKIVRVLGDPTEEVWPGMSDLPHSIRCLILQRSESPAWPRLFLPASGYAACEMQLLASLFAWDPVKRPTAESVLRSLGDEAALPVCVQVSHTVEKAFLEGHPVTESERRTLLEHLIEYTIKHHRSHNVKTPVPSSLHHTISTCFALVDRCLAADPRFFVTRTDGSSPLPTLGAAALFLSSKAFDVYPIVAQPLARHLRDALDDPSLTLGAVLQMERIVLRLVDADVFAATPCTALDATYHALCASDRLRAGYLTILAILDHRVHEFPIEAVASLCVRLATSTSGQGAPNAMSKDVAHTMLSRLRIMASHQRVCNTHDIVRNLGGRASDASPKPLLYSLALAYAPITKAPLAGCSNA